jgi:hypothetical protein
LREAPRTALAEPHTVRDACAALRHYAKGAGKAGGKGASAAAQRTTPARLVSRVLSSLHAPAPGGKVRREDDADDAAAAPAAVPFNLERVKRRERTEASFASHARPR